MKKEGNDLTRFCKHCGTELFFLDRFPKRDSNSKTKNTGVSMKPVKITVDILMLVFVILSLMRQRGDPTFHYFVGGIFGALFIIHFLLNFKTFISMSKKHGKLKTLMKFQYVVDIVLILIWSGTIITGIIAAANINTDSSIQGLSRLHGMLGRVGCGFILIHIIQHFRQIRSYFKIQKKENTNG